MTSQPDESCRTALIEALALLERRGERLAACYVAMAIDILDPDAPRCAGAEAPADGARAAPDVATPD